MSGLARVASALNVNDQCLARIAAVHLQMPDQASAAVRDALAAEDSLIKYARDEGAAAANWNPALHPRTGAPPNPGWFATTGGASHHVPNVHVAANDDPTRRSDASADVDDWVHLPPAKRIDELGDFLEWLANAKPEDEETIRREINRYWGSVGDFHALGTLNFMLSQVLKPGTTRQDRQQILELIDNYSRYDPAEVGQFYDYIYDLLALLGGGLLPRPRGKMPGTGKPAPAEPLESPASVAGQSLAQADAAAWKLGWAARGRYFEVRLGRTLHVNFPIIDTIPDGVATSIKSIDLKAATYQDAARLTYRLQKYVNEVSEFAGGRMGNDVFGPSDIQGRALSVAVPKGMTVAQRDAIETVRSWARMKNNNPVQVSITEF
jgi:contact-dependent growth inhibition (CDI) system restriction endonuclease-like protein